MNQFSASQIQVYQTCPWKYYLTNVLKISWPTPVTSFFKKQEADLSAGKRFHRFVQRYLQGVLPPAHLNTDTDLILARWIENFIQFNPLPSEAHFFVETPFSTLLEGTLWLGEFDCTALTSDKIMIFDWKTSEKALNSVWLRQNPQTWLYPFLLCRNLERLQTAGTSAGFSADQVELIYWNPNFPTAPLRFPYSQNSFHADKTKLIRLAAEFSTRDAACFPQVTDERVCMRCKFQTRCNRGTTPDPAPEPAFSDWEEIPPEPETDSGDIVLEL